MSPRRFTTLPVRKSSTIITLIFRITLSDGLTFSLWSAKMCSLRCRYQIKYSIQNSTMDAHASRLRAVARRFRYQLNGCSRDSAIAITSVHNNNNKIVIRIKTQQSSALSPGSLERRYDFHPHSKCQISVFACVPGNCFRILTCRVVCEAGCECICIISQFHCRFSHSGPIVVAESNKRSNWIR